MIITTRKRQRQRQRQRHQSAPASPLRVPCLQQSTASRCPTVSFCVWTFPNKVTHAGAHTHTHTCNACHQAAPERDVEKALELLRTFLIKNKRLG